MKSSVSRRDFLQAAIAAGTAVASGPMVLSGSAWSKEPRSANEKLNLAVIGVAGRGGENLHGVEHENIAVLCDIDDDRLNAAGQKHPGAKKISDYREVFDVTNLDGIVCSTPDHTHAIIVAAALKKGLPVYCEKPLTHSVYEARTLRQLNAAAHVPTQMGNQIHAGANYRRVVELIRSGAIGSVERVHVW
ncbi:MAG TPA: Gfo/Idh/MocA family oxidoreductase, partial [Schlesneria sp.]